MEGQATRGLTKRQRPCPLPAGADLRALIDQEVLLHKLKTLAPLLAACLCTTATAADQAELTRLIDSPTAGLVDKGRYGIALRLFANGGVQGHLDAGVLKRVTIGISFGGEHIIGDTSVDWQPRVEAAIRYRIIEENTALPALVLGYDTQGYGSHKNERYQIKSKGVYLVLSKNYLSSLGQFGVHGGANLSREDVDDDNFSGWIGVDKSFNEDFSLVAEYDLALNDNRSAALGSGEGYLNAGAHFALSRELRLGFYVKNLLGNGPDDPQTNRELTVLYTEEF